MDDVFSKLEAQLASASTSTPDLPETIQTGGLPPAAEITLATFNAFDNGPDTKGKWMTARFAMSTQLFTITEPITPTKALAAWHGTVQLHDPDFWIAYIEDKHEHGKIESATYERLKAIYTETFKTFPQGTLIGTLHRKSCGTTYEWNAVMRFWLDKFETPNLELHLDEVIVANDRWQIVKEVAGKKNPILRGRYDPNGLWKAKTRRPRP